MPITVHIGVIGSGKTYQSNKLIEQGYQKVSVADPMREILWKRIGWRPENDEEYQDFKNIEFAANDINLWFTGRDLLQAEGEAIKDLTGRDFWSKIWEQKVKELNIWHDVDNIVCDDLRFPEEIEAALRLKLIGLPVKFVFCNYHSDNYDATNKHISERFAQRLLALDKYQDNQEISIEDLKLINKTFYEQN